MYIFFLKYMMYNLQDLESLKSHPFFDSNIASRIDYIKNVELARINKSLHNAHIHNVYMELKSRLDHIQNLEEKKMIIDNIIFNKTSPLDTDLKKKKRTVDYIFIAPKSLTNKIINTKKN